MTHEDDSSCLSATPTPEVSVIIPAFNEERAIAATLEELLRVLDAGDRRYEIIVVDDGSTDDTAASVQQNSRIRLIRQRQNRGYGASLKRGVLAATAPIVVFYDADNQFQPQDVERLVQQMDQADAALGARTADSYTPFSRKGGKRLLGWLSNYLARTKIPDLNCGLRAIRRDVLMEYLHLLPPGFSASSTTTMFLLKEGYEVVFVPVTVNKRIGTSTVRPIKHGLEVALLMVRLTVLFDPFRVFGPTSVVLFLAGLAWGARYVVQGKGLSVAALFLMISAVLIFFFGLLTDQVSALRRERRYSDKKH